MKAHRKLIGYRMMHMFLVMTCFQAFYLSAENSDGPDPSEMPDQRFIDDLMNDEKIKIHLVDRNLNRPAKCPLRSELKLWDLHKRMKSVSNALKYGECYNKNKDVIDGFESLLNERDAYVSKLQNGPQASSGAVSSQPGSSTTPSGSMDQKQIFNVLTTVSQDEDCMMNVKKRGLLPVVADIATNVGLVASIMPTPNGFLIGASGVAVGSALKVINGLFQSPFNWKSAEDRKQFLDMNCSFFDLRRDIEAAEIADIQDIHIDEKISDIKSQQSRILKLINDNDAKRKAYLSKLEGMKHLWVKDTFGTAKLEFLAQLDSLMPTLEELSLLSSTSDVNKNVIRIEAVNLFMEKFPVMMELSDQIPDLPPYAEYLKELMKAYQWEKLGYFLDMDFAVFEKQYSHPLYFYFKKYRDDLAKQRDQKKSAWVSGQNKYTTSMTNDQVIKKTLTEYEAIDKRLKMITARLDTRVQTLNAKDRKLSFDTFDDGSHTTYDVLDEYQFIQSLIYGKLGFSFVNYFRKELYSEHKIFLKNYKKFRKTYKAHKRPVKPLEKVWACRDASQLRINWEKANSAAEVTWDFIGTNTGIFYTDVKKIRTFLYVIPVGPARQLLLYRYVRGAEYAKEVLDGKRAYRKKELEKFGSRHSHNLGELILDVRHSSEQRKELEDFWEKESCQVYM